ncbi:MAG: radical SAM family heme chaperone HemW [Desulfobulbaceae bacterium]|nr:radical SAM family heme chaperone HemW [Desulfobulbaceae bacterium]
MTPEPAGIYLHIPFCRSKCGYCAFASWPVAGHNLEDYLTALAKEIAFYREQRWCREKVFDSLFLGGGTPTILSAGQLSKLLAMLQESFTFSLDAEISVETNPNMVDAAKLAALTATGVNRLSIGIQSFDDQTLRRIDRTHTAADGELAVSLARQAGFTNLSLDLIYGLPGQTPREWRQTLAQAVALAPEHLSIYQLSIESGSHFAELTEAGKLPLPSENSEATMAEEAVRHLALAGYARYEISNYARPGKKCRHNLNYWRNRSWLGLGAAAVGTLSGLRLRNAANPHQYQRSWESGHPAWVEGESLDREKSFRETVIMGLRVLDGLDLGELNKRFEIDLHQYYGKTVDNLIAKGLLEMTSDRLRLTCRALPVANQVLAELV